MVNDGSSDNTADKVTEIANQYPKSIILANKENGGCGSTINVSRKLATGKYFKLLDADYYYFFEYLDGFIYVLRERKAAELIKDLKI